MAHPSRAPPEVIHATAREEYVARVESLSHAEALE
jgi:hypothetical protein